MDYGAIFSQKSTPQTQPIPMSNQVPNNGGGYGYEISKWTQLKRFLILGTCGGSYYVNETKLTVENAKAVVECIQENGGLVLEKIYKISQSGRAHKNEPAIFALVLAMTFGDKDIKAMAYKLIPSICRTGTHLFTLCQNIQDMRGWSAGLRRSIANFYTEKEFESLKVQVTKYRQRNNWTHKDVLRLCHAKPKNENQSNLFRWVVGKEENLVKDSYITAFEEIQKESTSLKDAIDLITKNKFSWEMLPTHLLTKTEIWKVLLPNLGMTALIRNLGRMTSIGLLKSNLDDAVQFIVKKLKDEEELKKARIHPMTILLAMKTYSAGKGFKGSLVWNPVQSILDALDEAFYKSFSNVEPSNKRFLIGLDVSGSMSPTIAGTNVTSREASSAMCMILKKTEPRTDIMAFSSGFIPVKFGERTRLDDICKMTEEMSFDNTDCSRPILWALANKIEVDVFVIFTDSETNSNSLHPSQAIKKYRKDMNLPNAKFVVCAMAANKISIADPKDAGMFDCIGLDADLPTILNQFACGEI